MSLATHVATHAGVDPKQAKTILAALEETILGWVHERGAGEFTLSGLLKTGVQQVPAKKKRFGKDPLTGEERWFAAKPATVRLKVRALKKLKDAADRTPQCGFSKPAFERDFFIRRWKNKSPTTLFNFWTTSFTNQLWIPSKNCPVLRRKIWPPELRPRLGRCVCSRRRHKRQVRFCLLPSSTSL